MNHYKNGALSNDDMVRATAEEIKIMHTKCMGPDDMITVFPEEISRRQSLVNGWSVHQIYL